VGVCQVSIGRALGREGEVIVGAVLPVRVLEEGKERREGGGRGVLDEREGGREITASWD